MLKLSFVSAVSSMALLVYDYGAQVVRFPNIPNVHPCIHSANYSGRDRLGLGDYSPKFNDIEQTFTWRNLSVPHGLLPTRFSSSWASISVNLYYVFLIMISIDIRFFCFVWPLRPVRSIHVRFENGFHHNTFLTVMLEGHPTERTWVSHITMANDFSDFVGIVVKS